MSAEHGVNFIEGVTAAVGLAGYEPLISAAVAGTALVIFASAAKKQLDASKNALVPDKTLSARNFFDLLIGFLLGVSDSALGRENRKYLPFVLTLFFYIFFMNLMGLIPGFSMATDNPAINVGLALTVFTFYHAWGVKAVGLGSYLKHFCGPVLALAILIFPLEIFSNCVRPLTLTVRLFGNMTADHTILSVFTDLTYIGVPVIFYGMGTFVSFIQAFVFTVLTMVYINQAVTHEHHEEAHH